MIILGRLGPICLETNMKIEKFKMWKLLVENQTDKRVKTLRTDNGLEFCNEEFNFFL